MTFAPRLLILCSLVSSLGIVSAPSELVVAQNSSVNCPTPALERFLRHTVEKGETLNSISSAYNLLPSSILNMNPNLRNRRLTVGSDILIPPYNGIVVEVARGQTWRKLGAKYKVRADVLFELNGCQPPSNIAFVPVVNGKPYLPPVSASPATPSSSSTETANPPQPPQQLGYPLPKVARVGLSYGWQMNLTNREVFFHSGIDLLAAKGSNVQAIAPGTVVFAERQGSYGNLVIINHSGGLQSRYAHLQTIQVGVGQQVQQGEVLGTVGITGTPTSSQPHLHFEMRSSSSLGWVAQDPRKYFQR
ncbi:MAG: M23 family metallopeptidase [Nostocaceae cyanobacterium]|nr:M23 family metallopeptidase [Nostocaceae cyanobacterium]